MKSGLLKKLAAIALFVFCLPAMAEDTDLFVGLPPSSTDLPNVLIVLDNTANWNSAFINEMAALRSTLTALPVNADGTAKFRIGFMLFTETGGGNSGNDGGYIRAAVRDFTSANKAKYLALLNSLDKVDDKSNGGKLGNTMADAYRYFAGGAPFSGNGKVKTDYTGNASGTAASNAIYALPGNALTSKNSTSYVSPVIDGSCAKNFIIYISNGAAQDNTSDTTSATDALKAAAGGGTIGTTAANPIAISPSGSQDNVGDEWARFMRKSGLGIVTYTIDVNKVTTGQGPGWTALLKSMASVSSGKYFDVNSATDAGSEISDALNSIFSEIQSVNSVFASVSLPVSVNTQGTYRNQVYIGMFRPDANAFPRWAGNLKQYRMGYLNGELKLLDANEATATGAINSSTGFITECARSYWTPTTLDTYWAFRPLGGCLTVPDSDASNYPDGNIVDKGAQAYKLRSSTARTVKTCSSTFASCTALTDFNNTNVTQSLLGAASTTERDQLVNWALGRDVDDENTDGASTTAMRPSAHGDVVHSRPVAINFGTEISPKVVVFYGGNDGVLRAVNGNRTAAIGSVAAGSELWAFIPPEFYSSIKRLRDNDIQINFPGNPTTSPTPAPKPYGLDGPVSAYKDDSHAWIYSTMRRGGRALYAFNVSVNDPANITLKWKKGCPNNFPASGTISDTDCSLGFSGIGQTWSAPKPFVSSGYGSPMIIMGGGYDTCEDSDENTCTISSKGRYIYVLDADTGTQLATFTTDRSVVADVIVVPDDDGNAIYAYAADLGGNIYRINIKTDAPGAWTMTKIASLGCDTVTTCAANRKFMFPPDIVAEDDGSYTILAGSGDREKPLGSYTSTAGVANYFFKFSDKPTDNTWLSSETANCGGNAIICKNSLYGITSDATPSDDDLAAKKGWYLALASTEQVVTSPITVFGVTTFSTHMPAVAVPGACTSNLGTAHVYNIDYSNAESENGTGLRYETISGGGLPPSPVAGMVTLDNGTTVPFCIGCDPDSPLEGGAAKQPASSIQPKARVYWYIEK